MIIKNTTILSKEEAIDEICKLSLKYYLKKYIFTAVLAIFGIIIIAVVAAQGNSTNTQVVGYLFLAFAGMLFLMNTYLIMTLRRRTIKKNPAIAEYGMVNVFTFKEESFSLQVKIGSSTNKIELPYTELKGMIEYDEKICFKIADTEAYICKKDCFSSKRDLDLFFYGLNKHKTKIKKRLSQSKNNDKNAQN